MSYHNMPAPSDAPSDAIPYNLAGIEDLREKREEVNRSIAKDEEEKGFERLPTAVLHLPTVPPPPVHAAKIQNDLRILTERLARINDNLARKISSRNEYDKTIQETEAAYAKARSRAR